MARALPTRVAASMHNLGSMSLEVDLSTRGAPCTCSAARLEKFGYGLRVFDFVWELRVLGERWVRVG